MNINHFEKQIETKLIWKKIEEIPNFPIVNFEEVKKKINTNEFSFGIDFTISNELAQWLYGKGHAIFFFALASLPFVVAIASVILAIIFKKWLLLFGVLFGFVGQITANPYNPLKNFCKPVAGSLFLVFVWGMWQNRLIVSFLSASFIFPFFANEFLYTMNQNKLQEVALNSEKVLIFLYQIGKLGLKDNASSKMYWYREAILEGAKKPKK